MPALVFRGSFARDYLGKDGLGILARNFGVEIERTEIGRSGLQTDAAAVEEVCDLAVNQALHVGQTAELHAKMLFRLVDAVLDACLLRLFLAQRSGDVNNLKIDIPHRIKPRVRELITR